MVNEQRSAFILGAFICAGLVAMGLIISSKVWCMTKGREAVLLALSDGYHESATSWEDVLIDLQQRYLIAV